MKKILVMGYGRVGRIFSRLALNASITVFDRADVSPPYPRLDQTRLDRLVPRDLSPFDLVANFLPVSHNKQVLALVADAGCGYMDLSCQEVETPEHFAFQDRFRERLLLAGAGIAPGLDNLLAARMVRKGARQVDIFLIEHLFSPDFSPSWCIEDALISMADRPVSRAGGRTVIHENFSHPESLATSQGDFTCYRFFGEEVLTLGHTFPSTGFSLKAGGGEIEAARDLFARSLALGPEQVRKIFEAAEHEADEPDGIFGIHIRSDRGKSEVFLDPGSRLKREGVHGNHISFHTAFAAWSMLETAMAHSLTGLYYPEMLPESLQQEILDKIKVRARVWDI